MAVQSIESKITELANEWLKSYKLDYKLEQETLNSQIDKALKEYESKSGGNPYLCYPKASYKRCCFICG